MFLPIGGSAGTHSDDSPWEYLQHLFRGWLHRSSLEWFPQPQEKNHHRSRSRTLLCLAVEQSSSLSSSKFWTFMAATYGERAWGFLWSPMWYSIVSSWGCLRSTGRWGCMKIFQDKPVCDHYWVLTHVLTDCNAIAYLCRNQVRICRGILPGIFSDSFFNWSSLDSELQANFSLRYAVWVLHEHKVGMVSGRWANLGPLMGSLVLRPPLPTLQLCT